MSGIERVTVLLSPEQAARLSQYCATQGYKKSTLIARLVKEYLDLTLMDVHKITSHPQNPANSKLNVEN